MSIEISWLDGTYGSDRVFLTDKGFEQLTAGLSLLQARAGIVIDQYSDTRLSPEHAQILLESIESSRDHLPGFDLDGLLEMLQRSVNESRWLLVVGD